MTSQRKLSHPMRSHASTLAKRQNQQGSTSGYLFQPTHRPADNLSCPLIYCVNPQDPLRASMNTTKHWAAL